MCPLPSLSYDMVSLLFEKRPGYIVDLQVTCFPGNPPMKKKGGSSPGDIFPVCRAKSAHVSMVITLKSVYMDCLSNRSGNRRQQTKRLEAIFQIPLIHIFWFFVWGGANVVWKKPPKTKAWNQSIRFFEGTWIFLLGLCHWLTVLLSVSKTRQGSKGLCQLWIRVLRFSEGLGHKDGGQVHHDLAEKATLFGPLEVHCRSCRA